MIDVSSRIAEEAARLRAFHRILPTDALHLATALVTEATTLLTNDARLPEISDLRIIQLARL